MNAKTTELYNALLEAKDLLLDGRWCHENIECDDCMEIGTESCAIDAIEGIVQCIAKDALEEEE
jgi:hypothetical protein